VIRLSKGFLICMRVERLREDVLARDNYSYKKYQRELAQKKKREEKLQKKLAKKAAKTDGEVQPVGETEAVADQSAE